MRPFCHWLSVRLGEAVNSVSNVHRTGYILDIYFIRLLHWFQKKYHVHSFQVQCYYVPSSRTQQSHSFPPENNCFLMKTITSLDCLILSLPLGPPVDFLTICMFHFPTLIPKLIDIEYLLSARCHFKYFI